jgi:dihydroorotate dehydrogenase electron transfer subunit
MSTKAEKPSIATGPIMENRCLASGHFLLTIRLPNSFTTPSPGQFVMIRNSDLREPLLPRPLSVYGFHREDGHAILNLFFRVIGRGTSLLSRLNPGASLTILGPLGRGFTIDPDIRKIILVAGGVGAAPLVFLLQQGYRKISPNESPEMTAYIGARTAELLTGLDDCFQGYPPLRTATDDGSRGYHGPVTELLKNNLSGYDADSTVILGCGPWAMLRSLDLLLRDTRIRCQVSLEERMACGVGACLGCVVAVKEGEGQTGYRRVCHDGPVFNIRDIVWNPPAEA